MSTAKRVSHQERTEQTRELILDAAVELFAEMGVENTTVSAVIETSEVSRTTFYRYFQDLADVLNASLRRDFESLLADFAAQRFEHTTLEAQIIDDFVWFTRQLSTRSALVLLFRDESEIVYRLARESLDAFKRAGLTCSQPTYERAQREGRLRDGVTLEAYVEWATFIVTSLQTQSVEFAKDEIKLRLMLQKFLVPSLIR